jgi:hypothetical protein
LLFVAGLRPRVSLDLRLRRLDGVVGPARATRSTL